MNLCTRPLPALRTFRHVNSTFVLPSQCRTVFVLHAVMHPAKNKILNEKLTQFRREVRIFGRHKGAAAEKAYRQSQKLALFSNELPRQHLGDFTLEEVRENMLGEGVVLAPYPGPTRNPGWRELPRYVLVKIQRPPMFRTVAKEVDLKGRAGLILFLHTSMETAQFMQIMARAFKVIANGLRVEFHVYATSNIGKRISWATWNSVKKSSKSKQIQERAILRQSDMPQFSWYNDDVLEILKVPRTTQTMYHLHPDIIKAAMPAKTGYVVESRGNWREYIFAMGPPAIDGTVKNYTAVFDSIVETGPESRHLPRNPLLLPPKIENMIQRNHEMRAKRELDKAENHIMFLEYKMKNEIKTIHGQELGDYLEDARRQRNKMIKSLSEAVLKRQKSDARLLDPQPLIEYRPMGRPVFSVDPSAPIPTPSEEKASRSEAPAKYFWEEGTLSDVVVSSSAATQDEPSETIVSSSDSSEAKSQTFKTFLTGPSRSRVLNIRSYTVPKIDYLKYKAKNAQELLQEQNRKDALDRAILVNRFQNPEKLEKLNQPLPITPRGEFYSGLHDQEAAATEPHAAAPEPPAKRRNPVRSRTRRIQLDFLPSLFDESLQSAGSSGLDSKQPEIRVRRRGRRRAVAQMEDEAAERESNPDGALPEIPIRREVAHGKKKTLQPDIDEGSHVYRRTANTPDGESEPHRPLLDTIDACPGETSLQDSLPSNDNEQPSTRISNRPLRNPPKGSITPFPLRNKSWWT
ncbi:hypothetical protein PVAG01_07933 [Phlyctema vagabunda]|uniref:Uncharacterized protein n=1 Tax=Phlyctema vagabunda TaxID=108571 RepID=A0ABR4PDT8_9HELO